MTRYSTEEKSRHITLWQASGKTKLSYSKESGVSYETLLPRILSAQKKDGSYVPRMEKRKNFIPISLSELPKAKEEISILEISYPNGVHVTLPGTHSCQVIHQTIYPSQVY